MEPSPHPSLADSIAGAHGWWREAGVDLAYHDTPRGWLAVEEQQVVAAGPPPVPARARIGGERASWPRDLSAFAQWWVETPGLDAGPPRGRIAPRGPAGAPLMIMVPMPEAEDSNLLLSGPQGRMLANMVRARGFALDAVYVSAALPRHMALPEWSMLADEGLGDVLLHHLALAAPQRLIVLGRDILPLLGHTPAQGAPAVSELTIQSVKLRLLSSYAPGRLVDHPRLRAELWRQWLDWTGTE
ncbi:MAG: hypothetical protein ABIT09_10770 [Croceibacterium sp.]